MVVQVVFFILSRIWWNLLFNCVNKIIFFSLFFPYSSVSVCYIRKCCYFLATVEQTIFSYCILFFLCLCYRTSGAGDSFQPPHWSWEDSESQRKGEYPPATCSNWVLSSNKCMPNRKLWQLVSIAVIFFLLLSFSSKHKCLCMLVCMLSQQNWAAKVSWVPIYGYHCFPVLQIFLDLSYTHRATSSKACSGCLHSFCRNVRFSFEIGWLSPCPLPSSPVLFYLSPISIFILSIGLFLRESL